jgi:2,4-dienoyl-CoA reductase-like NADH-dependent reductase (Old Yellow Enzyme family)/thioredoxin reductase
MSRKPELGKLFEPCNIGKLQLKNRVVMPPMGNNFGAEDGGVTPQLIDYYNERALGGPGLIITEMVSIDSPLGQRGIRQLRIDDDCYIPGLRRLAQQVHDSGGKMALQLCHAGLLAASNNFVLQPVAPSPVEYFGKKVTVELSKEEIQDIIDHFVKGAVRAKAAGFDGVEVHAAHSYLLAHFLSPYFNRRCDKYGGNVKNRAKILLEIISGIRKAAGEDYPVWCRINGMEYGLEGGLTINEAQEIAQMAEVAGCAAIHVSGGGYGTYFGYNRAGMGQPEGNLAELAGAIKKAVKIPVIAVGRINLQLAEKLLRELKADLIAIGRAQIAEPHLVSKATAGKYDDIRPCISCNVCVDDLTVLDVSLHCSVNACVGKERESRITPAKIVKNVLVIGGGPAGMEAAIVAAQRGHRVTIYEKQPQLGGKLNPAAVPPGKDEIRPLIDFFVHQVQKLGISVESRKEADAASIKQLKPDVIIVAAGGIPGVPPIPGVAGENVVFAEQVLCGIAVGQHVVIIGGGLVGCETAEFLAKQGKKITVIEMLNELAAGVGSSFKVGLIGRLSADGITMMTGVNCKKIFAEGVVITARNGKEQMLAADTVVLAAGAKPDRRLLQEIKGLAPEIYPVGDCVEPRRILEAVSDGHRIGLLI